MYNHLALIVFSLYCFGIAQAGGVSEKACSRVEEFQAETEIEGLNDWPLVYRAYLRFGHCDDGAIAEGYSDTVIRLLTDQWDQIAELNRLALLNNKFEKFVLHHIDELATKNDLQTILKNTQKSCPKKAQRLCRSIEDAVR